MKNLLADKIYRMTGADALVVTQDDFRFYLTNFESSFGVVVVDAECAKFYTDNRYLEAAKNFCADGFEVLEYPRGTSLSQLLKGYKSIALSLLKTPAADYISLKEAGYEITDSTSAFERCMAVKAEYELKNIRAACAAAELPVPLAPPAPVPFVPQAVSPKRPSASAAMIVSVRSSFFMVVFSF